MSDLRVFRYCPTEASYAAEDSADQYRRTQLQGGEGRYRADLAGVSKIVNCRWVLDASGYDYGNAFFRVFKRKPVPFLIDLIIDEAALIGCKAWFTSGPGWKLSEKRGGTYTVTAQLEVIPPLYDPAIDEALLDLMGEFGEDWRDYLDRLHVLVNVKLPEAMPKWLM